MTRTCMPADRRPCPTEVTLSRMPSPSRRKPRTCLPRGGRVPGLHQHASDPQGADHRPADDVRRLRALADAGGANGLAIRGRGAQALGRGARGSHGHRARAVVPRDAEADDGQAGPGPRRVDGGIAAMNSILAENEGTLRLERQSGVFRTRFAARPTQPVALLGRCRGGGGGAAHDAQSASRAALRQSGLCAVLLRLEQESPAPVVRDGDLREPDEGARVPEKAAAVGSRAAKRSGTSWGGP